MTQIRFGGLARSVPALSAPLAHPWHPSSTRRVAQIARQRLSWQRMQMHANLRTDRIVQIVSKLAILVNDRDTRKHENGVRVRKRTLLSDGCPKFRIGAFLRHPASVRRQRTRHRPQPQPRHLPVLTLRLGAILENGMTTRLSFRASDGGYLTSDPNLIRSHMCGIRTLPHAAVTCRFSWRRSCTVSWHIPHRTHI